MTDQELGAWKQSAQILNDEVGNIRSELAFVEDPVERAKLEQRLNEIEPYVSQVNQTIQEATTGSDMGWGLRSDLPAGPQRRS
jgi:hypothetical protein